MNAQPTHVYTRALKSALPPRIHKPARSRLLWLPTHVLVITLGLTCLALGWLPWSLAWLVTLVLGVSFAGLTFLGHETLHGAVVHGRRAQRLVGWLGFLPFTISPRLWVAWHNRVHHNRTNQPGIDPDSFPTREAYDESGATRFMIDRLGAARGAPGGPLALLIGFTIQSVHMLVSARSLNLLSRRQHRLAVAETALGLGLWLGLALTIGWLPFLFGYLLPLLIANAIVMAHILTNHSLSPLTAINDPLLNSLSVTVPRWMEWLTLGFGFHVEHHLYPWMSTRHARAVRQLVMARWPERYQSMPLWRALSRVYSTGRVYADATTLIDVRSGRQWSTLAPRDLVSAPAPLAAVPESSRRVIPTALTPVVPAE